MIIEGPTRWLSGQVRERFPRFVHINPPTPEFQNKFLSLLPNGKAIGCAPHWSHVDGLVASDAAEYLINMVGNTEMGFYLPRFLMPVAMSMEGGQQGFFLKNVYPNMRDYSKDRGVDHMSVTREKDKKAYNAVSPLAMMKLYQRLLVDRSIMGFPSASVDAGRHTGWWWNDSFKGLREMTEDTLYRFYVDSLKYDSLQRPHPFFFTVIYEGTQHLYSPDSKLPTPEGLIGLFDQSREFMTERFGYEQPVIEVSFGDIFTDDELGLRDLDYRRIKRDDKYKVVKHLNHTIMGSIAARVDEKYRGFYSTPRTILEAA